LRASGSAVGITRILKNLTKRPHLTRLYQAYLSRFTPENSDLVSDLEQFMESPELVTDYQRMYLLGALLNAKSIDRSTVNIALQWLKNPAIAQELRAISAIFAARHGTPLQKRAVRLAYEAEPSPYVRSAILYASRYSTKAEERTCKKAWGGHSLINALVAQAIKA
jgi:hypothetical protein